jgi:hypothetical protein
VKGGVLTVVCPPGLARAEGFNRWITDQLAPYSVQLQIELAPPDLLALQNRFEELDCRLLVVGTETVEGRADCVRELSQRVSCDLLFVH